MWDENHHIIKTTIEITVEKDGKDESIYLFPGGKAKALTMSYDDGKVQDRRLIDIFNKYGIKGTFNLNYGQVGERPA